MDAEQRISASAFTHRGIISDANTNNFILDGRHLFGFELDNSHVSIINKDRNFFFAVCDTKPNEYLNTAVSGIKELKKLSAQFKTGNRDIKTKSDQLGECFVNTENLLYESGSYANPNAKPKSRHLASLDKKLSPYSGKDPDIPDDADETFDKSGSRFERDFQLSGFDQNDEEYDELDDEYDYDENEEEDSYQDELDYQPGSKGFSSVGLILSDGRGSILAQGDCEAFLLRANALRSISRDPRKTGEQSGRSPKADQNAMRRGQTARTPAFTGRASEIFDPREGDVYLLCTTSVINAIGEENIDEYLAMQEDTSVISSRIIYDAVKNDAESNLTCLVVRIEASYKGENLNTMPKRADFKNSTSIQGKLAQMQANPVERDTNKIPVKQSYQNKDAFSNTAKSRFDPPPRKYQSKGSKSLVTTVITTVLLLVLLFATYFILQVNRDNEEVSTNRPNTTSTTKRPSQTSTTTADPEDEYGDEEDDEVRTTTEQITTTVTTTQAPEQTHKVKSGETLSKISEKYYNNARYVDLIKQANNLESDNIRIDQVLIIPPKPDPTTTTIAAAEESTTRGAATTAGRQSTQ